MAIKSNITKEARQEALPSRKLLQPGTYFRYQGTDRIRIVPQQTMEIKIDVSVYDIDAEDGTFEDARMNDGVIVVDVKFTM